jgi:hypothetical protein
MTQLIALGIQPLRENDRAFERLTGLTNLRYLGLDGGRREVLDGLENLPWLTALDLYELRGEPDLTAIAALPNLRQLRIRFTKGLDLRPLMPFLTRLELLKIEGLGYVGLTRVDQDLITEKVNHLEWGDCAPEVFERKRERAAKKGKATRGSQ